MIMKKIICLVFIANLSAQVFAQDKPADTFTKVTVTKDPRLDILAKVQSDHNKNMSRMGRGYRLFVLKSDNREYAMRVRAYLLQNYPDEKVIMTYQSPFIKMKFGDFVEKKDAEKIRDQILKAGVVTGNIYVVPDTIEIKPDKNEPEDSK
jgi:hypothetical protein